VIAGPLKPAEMISDFPRVMSEIRRLFLAIGILLLATGDGGAERINQEGRILGPAPQVARPTLFNTPEADAVVSAMNASAEWSSLQCGLP
jgi:hypothetical protein